LCRWQPVPYQLINMVARKFCDEFWLRCGPCGAAFEEIEWNGSFLQTSWRSIGRSKLPWLANKTGATRLGFAALLKFFESEGRFPRNREELPPLAIHFLAQQVHVPADAWGEYRWEGRTKFRPRVAGGNRDGRRRAGLLFARCYFANPTGPCKRLYSPSRMTHETPS
jgi:hypothetical protein